MVSESSDLKYFGGVQATTGQAANYTSDVAGKVYTSVKQYVPEGLQPHLKVAEDKMSEYGSPALTTLQDKGGKFLQVADSKVDGAANSAFSLHDKHYPQFQQAKDQYLKVVEEKVSTLRENGISGTVGQAADAVSARTNSAVAEAKKLPGFVNKQTEVALDRVEDAVNQVSSWPIVQKVWGQAKPTADIAWKKYSGLHNIVVSQPLYHKAYSISTDVISQTQSTGIYKATVPRVYSTISPVADPVLHKIQSTEAYKIILDQFQPIST
ncbi:hypothetical protein WJX77_009189 [Trebouxia sp. C0004]